MTDMVPGGTSASPTPLDMMMSLIRSASNGLLFRDDVSPCTARYTPGSLQMSPSAFSVPRFVAVPLLDTSFTPSLRYTDEIRWVSSGVRRYVMDNADCLMAPSGQASASRLMALYADS